MRPALRIGKQKSAIESNACIDISQWRRSRLVSVGAVSAARNQPNYPGIAIAIPRMEMRNFGAKRLPIAVNAGAHWCAPRQSKTLVTDGCSPN
jgi:hypothetical protein